MPQVARSIRRYGFIAPVVVWQSKDRLVAGHTRVLALEAILRETPGFVPRDAPGAGLVPVRFHEFTDEAEANAYALADNRLNELAEWDEEALADVLRDLRACDEKLLAETGFSDGELRSLLSTTTGAGRGAAGDDAQGGPDDADRALAIALQEKWKTAPGQVWAIPSRSLNRKEHRIACGDARDPAVLARALEGQRASLLVWDPPFNVGFNYDGAYEGEDAKSSDEYAAFLACCIAAFEAHAEAAHAAFVWQGAPNLRFFERWFAGRDWRVVPVAKNFIQARPTWMQWAWDPVVAWRSPDFKAKTSVQWRDYFAANTALTASTPDRRVSGAHPCPRTVDAALYFIEGWSASGEVVVDLSLGSGTTMVAAEKAGRVCAGVELEPRYVAVELERLVLLGLEPHLVEGT